MTTALGYTPVSNALTAANIWVGNSSNQANAVALSGDATISNAGVLTLANSGVTTGTYHSVTVDAKGRVTGGTNPTTLAGHGITDAIPNGATANAIILGSSDSNNVTIKTNNVTRMTIDPSGAAAITGTLSTTGTLTSGGALTVSAGGLTVSAGGESITGNSTITGNLSTTGTITSGGALTVSSGGLGITTGGLTVSAGGESITGNSSVTGNISASGTVTSGGALTVTTGGLTVSAGGATVTGNSTITGTANVTSDLTTGGALILSTQSIASGTNHPLDGSSAAKSLDASKSVVIYTGTSATTISCINAGTNGQIMQIMFIGAIATSSIITHNAACTNGKKILTSTAANLTSATAASTAYYTLIYESTTPAWHVISSSL